MIDKNYIFALLISFSGCSNLDVASTKKFNRVDLHHFNNYGEAESFFFSRRLDYLRYYELTSEPYFGTPKELDCKNNINIKAEVIARDKYKYYFLKLVEDQKENITDCLLIEERKSLYIGAILCSNKVTILKESIPIAEKDLISFCN